MVRRAVVCVGVCVVLLAARVSAQNPTISLKAVMHNPTCIDDPLETRCFSDADCSNGCGGSIAPTNTLEAGPGDIIVAEILASNWSPAGQSARSYQAMIDRPTFFNGCGAVLPLGWDRPIEIIGCQQNGDCPSEWPICHEGMCAGPSHDPSKGAFIDTARNDFIYSGISGRIDAINYWDYRYGAYLIFPYDAPLYSPPPKYCATLILEVQGDAAGVFEVAFDTDGTYLRDRVNELILPLDLESLTISVGEYHVPGDLDGDGDCDHADHSVLVDCMAGPETSYEECCDVADMDTGGDVDLNDYAIWQNWFQGSM